MRGHWRHIAVVALAAAANGCAALRGVPANAPVEGEWSSTLDQARQEALATRFGIADNILSEFSRRHPGAVEALDANYYRALYKLDPANPTGTIREADALLDAYLAVSGPLPLRADVTSLRRIATALERGGAVAAATPPGASSGTTGAATSPDVKSLTEENQRLKDDLAKANAELERIKRRVAQPKP